MQVNLLVASKFSSFRLAEDSGGAGGVNTTFQMLQVGSAASQPRGGAQSSPATPWDGDVPGKAAEARKAVRGTAPAGAPEIQ